MPEDVLTGSDSKSKLGVAPGLPTVARFVPVHPAPVQSARLVSAVFPVSEVATDVTVVELALVESVNVSSTVVVPAEMLVPTGSLPFPNVKVEEWAAYIKDLIAKTLTPVAFIGMSTFPDADPMLTIHVSGNVYSYFASEKLDDILKQARTTTDAAKRASLYKEATQRLHDDPPGIMLYQQVDLYGTNKRVLNWKPRPDERLLLQQGSVGIDVK